MSQPPPNPYGAAFKHWRSARERLERIIQDYIDACEQLDFVFNKSPAPITRHLRDQAFAELDLELPLLVKFEQNLSKYRCSLKTLRNSSPSLSPINSLPPEILLSILFSVHQQQDWRTNVYVGMARAEADVTRISSVCRLWRRLMLNTTSFWSQIQLPLNTYPSMPDHKTAELRVQRSRDALLDVLVSENNYRPWWKIGVTHWGISHAIEFLTALFPRVRNLKIDSKDDLANMIARRFITSWVDQGTVGMADELHILLNEGLDEEFDGVSLPGDETDITSKSFITFFTSLRVLRLRNAVIDLKTLACTRLEDLYLHCLPGWHPTTSDIVKVLASNPRLRSLVFIDIPFISNLPLTTDPIAVDKLEVLTLQAYTPLNLWSVLRLVKSSSDGVQLTFSMDTDAQYVESLHLFSERCRITNLWLNSESHSNFHISAILIPMPHLQTVCLCNFTFTGNTLQDFVSKRSSDPWPLHIWPNLKKFHVSTSTPPPEEFVSHLSSLLLPTQELLIAPVSYPLE